MIVKEKFVIIKPIIKYILSLKEQLSNKFPLWILKSEILYKLKLIKEYQQILFCFMHLEQMEQYIFEQINWMVKRIGNFEIQLARLLIMCVRMEIYHLVCFHCKHLLQLNNQSQIYILLEGYLSFKQGVYKEKDKDFHWIIHYGEILILQVELLLELLYIQGDK